MRKPNKIVFIHIPKTAGTSLRRAIESSFSSDRIAPYENLYDLNRAKHHDYDLFRGHFGFKDTRFVPGEKQYISVLRDPVDRVISLYNFWKKEAMHYTGSRNKDPNYEGVKLAQKVSLGEFLNTKNTQILNEISNSQYRYLLKGIREDYRFGDIIDISKAAKVVNDKYLWIGFVDTIAQDYEILQKKLGLKDMHIPYVNRTRDKSSRVSNRDISKIHSMNQVDYLLYHELKKLNRIQTDLSFSTKLAKETVSSKALAGL